MKETIDDIVKKLQESPSVTKTVTTEHKNDNRLIPQIMSKIEDLEFTYDTMQGIDRRKQDGLLVRDTRSARTLSKDEAKQLDQIGFQMQILNEYLAAAVVLTKIEDKTVTPDLEQEIKKALLKNPPFPEATKHAVGELRTKLTSSLEAAGVVGLYDDKTAHAPVTGEKTTRQGKYSKALACASMERDNEYSVVTISAAQNKKGDKKTIIEVTDKLLPHQTALKDLPEPTDPIDKKLFNAYKDKFSTHVIPTYMRATVPTLPRHAFKSSLFTMESGELKQHSEQFRTAAPAFIPIGVNDGKRAQDEGYKEAVENTKKLIQNLAQEMGHTAGGPPICLNLLFSPTQKNSTHPYAYTTKVIDEALKQMPEEFQNVVIAKTPVNPWRFFEKEGKGIDYSGFEASLKHLADGITKATLQKDKQSEVIMSYVRGDRDQYGNSTTSLSEAKTALKHFKDDPAFQKELANLVECRDWISGGMPLTKPHHKLAAKMKSACDSAKFGELSNHVPKGFEPPKFASFCMEGKDRTTVSTLYTHAMAFASKFSDFKIKDIAGAMVKSGHNQMITSTFSILGAFGQKQDSVNLFSSPDASLNPLHKKTAESKWKTTAKKVKKNFVEKLFGDSKDKEKSNSRHA
jgi:hypothetical protein